MVKLEGWVEIKVLSRQGRAIRDIARTVGVSRNTVRKYLRGTNPPHLARTVRRVHKLDPYKPFLSERLQVAFPLRLPATVLYGELQAQGYDGGISRLRDYLRSLKPAPIEDPVVRFETAPGHQLQVDWLVLRRREQPLSAFVATLSYSRASYVEFVTDERLETLMGCHARAFEYFGGVPAEVLYDNMRTVVLERDAYGPGQHRFHPTFLDFAHHYGFRLRLCRPYRAKTKGKVERFNRYVRESFYNPLVSRLKHAGLQLDAATANYEVQRWLQHVANQRVHATTQERPERRLDLERAVLQPLPRPYTGQPVEPRPASSVLASPAGSSVVLQRPLTVYEELVCEARA